MSTSTSPGAPTDLFDLTGRVALVTGGSRGIGRAIATTFSRAGADVVVASRKAPACIEAAAAIAAETGRSALGVGCHVARWDDCEALVATTYEHFGRCDVLVNNAGVSPLYDSLASIGEDYWDKVTAVNLKGPFRLSTLVGPRMAAADGGSIINVGTIVSLRPGPGELVYACAKAGLNALTVGLAGAFGPSVRSNAILPGAVDTDIATAWPEAMRQAAAAASPTGRLGVPDDFAGAALWLASDASAWVTGAIVRVDGGTGRQVS